MSDMFVYMYVCMYVYMYVCMYQELLKKPQQIPRVFAHTWRIKLILILILKRKRREIELAQVQQPGVSVFQQHRGKP